MVEERTPGSPAGPSPLAGKNNRRNLLSSEGCVNPKSGAAALPDASQLTGWWMPRPLAPRIGFRMSVDTVLLCTSLDAGSIPATSTITI
jgi:hypothetical protein